MLNNLPVLKLEAKIPVELRRGLEENDRIIEAKDLVDRVFATVI